LLGLMIWGLMVWEICHLAKYPKKIAPRVLMGLVVLGAFSSQVALMEHYSPEDAKRPHFDYFVFIESGSGLVLMFGTMLMEYRKDKSRLDPMVRNTDFKVD